MSKLVIKNNTDSMLSISGVSSEGRITIGAEDTLKVDNSVLTSNYQEKLDIFGDSISYEFSEDKKVEDKKKEPEKKKEQELKNPEDNKTNEVKLPDVNEVIPGNSEDKSLLQINDNENPDESKLPKVTG